ncbi:MAG TPA: ABC transporter permease [Caulobacteraceae bacterium]|nr:ABC transporter permease [Caulobacteraceae bacterium]
MNSSRRRPAPLDLLRLWPLRAWVAAVAVFLYAPLAVLVAFSFNDDRRGVVWRGFTTRWFVRAAGDADLMQAFGNSLVIALASTAVSVVLGTGAALMLWRFRFPAKPLVEGALGLPIVVPEICMGAAMLVFFSQILPWPTQAPWPFNLGAIVISHVSFSFSFVAVVVRARLASFPPETAEAARDLGAGEGRVLRTILVPHMTPALIAGALLAFTLSLDDFVITFFTSGPDTVTFPVKVYSMVRFSVSPEVNAASTALMAITLCLTAVAVRLQGHAVVRAAQRGEAASA